VGCSLVIGYTSTQHFHLPGENNKLPAGKSMQLEFQVCDHDLSNAVLSQYLRCWGDRSGYGNNGLLPHRDRFVVQLWRSSNCYPHRAKQKDAPNLKQLMEADGPQVFHFARFDIATLRYHLGIQVAPIFCTKIGSKLARTYTNRHGLKDLVELEQVELDKSAQSSDWATQLIWWATLLRRDVRYLLVRLKLIEMLKREERWELAQASFQCLPTIVSTGLFEHWVSAHPILDHQLHPCFCANNDFNRRTDVHLKKSWIFVT